MNLKLSQEQVNGVIRHVMTGVGSILIMKGTVDEATWVVVTGSILGVAGILWSVFSKG